MLGFHEIHPSRVPQDMVFEQENYEDKSNRYDIFLEKSGV